MPKRIKSNEDIFNKWMDLKHSLPGLAGIVQNDQILTVDHVREWGNTIDLFLERVLELKRETIGYIFDDK